MAILILAGSILCFTALAANLNLPPLKASETFTDKQAKDEAGMVWAGQLNHVNNSSPSNYYGATYNNVNKYASDGSSDLLFGDLHCGRLHTLHHLACRQP